MDKASTFGNSSGRKSIIPKPITPIGHGAAAPLGTKIPAHMTPDEKSQLLNRLHEWRKAKIQAKQDVAGKSKIPSVVPTIVKPKIPATSMIKPTDGDIVNNTSNIKKEEKENVFERLFRNATRVSSAKVVEKAEPKGEPVRNSRLSVKPKKVNSSSSLQQQTRLSNSASKKVSAVETRVIDQRPTPVDVLEKEPKMIDQQSAQVNISKEEPKIIDPQPVQVNILKQEPKIIDQEPSPVDILNKIEQHLEFPTAAEENKSEIDPFSMEVIKEEPIETLEGPMEVLDRTFEVLDGATIYTQPEQVPEPEAFEEIISEPTENLVTEEEVKPIDGDTPTEFLEKMDNDEALDESEEKTPIIQNQPIISISKPEKVKEELKVPHSEEKPVTKPSVKFASEEKPKKKISFPKIKPINNNVKKPLITSKSQKPVKAPIAKEEKKPKTKIRRSISMIHRKKSGNVNSAIHRAISEQNLSFTEPEIEVPKPKEDIEKRISRRRSKSVTFFTPKGKTPTPVTLTENLETWLKVRGHSISGYRHLKCFGIHTQKNAVFQTPNRSISDLEVSQYATAPNSPNMSFLEDSDKENVTPATAVQKVDIKEAEGWLSDLHKLIVDLKYPYNRCEEWLSAIRRKCISCTQLPIYWECLAALEQSRGDMNTAIEYYERAIIKGAEVEEIGESLEKLFDKLVIDSNKQTPSKPDKNIDPKNIFKSTIIKFALQQKTVKELGPEIGDKARQQLYIATPVRRSTRLQTPYKPHVVNSLQSLDEEMKSNVKFQPNKFLEIEK